MQIVVVGLLFTIISSVHGQWLLLNGDSPPIITTEADAKLLPRHDCAAWCIGDDIYIYGGKNDNNQLKDFWKYETENQRWLWMPNPPDTLPGTDGAPHWEIMGNAYIYTLAGQLWTFEPLSRTWSIVQSTNSGPLLLTSEKHAYWTHKPSNQLFLFTNGNASASELWAFNVVSLNWRSVPFSGTIPSTGSPGKAVLGNSEDTVYYFSDQLYQLDITTMTWSQSPSSLNVPNGRTDFSLFMTTNQDKVSLFGGRVGSRMYNDYWLYDPEVEEWIHTDVSGLPSGRWGTCGCTDRNGDYYMFGGTFEDPKHFHNDLWKNGQLRARNIFQILDLKLDAVTLSSLVAAVMSTILTCTLFMALLCMCVKKCRRERGLINSYKADQGISL